MFKLPQLPYAFDALEPYIDAQTMEIHYTKHHQAYVDNLNKALESQPALYNKSLHELLTNLNSIPTKIRTAVRNNGGGDYNHTFFWPLLAINNGKLPNGRVAEAIKKSFGNFEAFKNIFSNVAKEVFGSGWAWLILNTKGDLEIAITYNQDAPLAQSATPILGLDVWEHAYYLKYQNKRIDYIEAFWNVINWDQVEHNYNNSED